MTDTKAVRKHSNKRLKWCDRNACDFVRCRAILWCQAWSQQQTFHVWIQRQRAPGGCTVVNLCWVQNECGTIVLTEHVVASLFLDFQFSHDVTANHPLDDIWAYELEEHQEKK